MILCIHSYWLSISDDDDADGDSSSSFVANSLMTDESNLCLECVVAQLGRMCVAVVRESDR